MAQGIQSHSCTVFFATLIASWSNFSALCATSLDHYLASRTTRAYFLDWTLPASETWRRSLALLDSWCSVDCLRWAAVALSFWCQIFSSLPSFGHTSRYLGSGSFCFLPVASRHRGIFQAASRVDCGRSCFPIWGTFREKSKCFRRGATLLNSSDLLRSQIRWLACEYLSFARGDEDPRPRGLNTSKNWGLDYFVQSFLIASLLEMSVFRPWRADESHLNFAV